MKDKLSEFRDLMGQRKSAAPSGIDDAVHDAPAPALPTDGTPDAEALPDAETSGDNWQKLYEEARHAAAIQRDQFMRQAAEFENMRKRLRKEFEENSKYAGEKIVKDLIPILDNLEMSLTHAASTGSTDPLMEGVRLTLKQFAAVLLQNGVEEISGQGSPFDPNTQEAIGTSADADVPSGHVAQVHRKGYQLNGRLIRAAMVTVKA